MSKKRTPKTFAEVIDLWPEAKPPDDKRPTGRLYTERRFASSIQSFADDIGIPYSHAQIMRRRNSVHVRYWPKLVEAARRRKIAGITHELLSTISANQASKHELRGKAAVPA